MVDIVNGNLATSYDLTQSIWTDSVTLSLDEGTWLLVGQAVFAAGGSNLDVLDLYGAIYDHASGNSYNLMRKEAPGGRSRTFPNAGIVSLAAPGNVSLRHTKAGLDNVPVTVVASSQTYGYGDAPTTHLTAIRLPSGADYQMVTPAADIVMADGMQRYTAMSVDLTPGSWLLVSCVTFSEADAGFLMFSDGISVRRYIEDSGLFGEGGPAFLIHDVVTITQDTTWTTQCMTNSPGSVLYGTLTVPGVGPTASASTMLAVQLASDDAVTGHLADNVSVTQGAWFNGPSVTLTGGTWFVMGTAHFFLSGQSADWLSAGQLTGSPTPYAVAVRNNGTVPTGRASVVNVAGAVIEIPEDDTDDVGLQVRTETRDADVDAVSDLVPICPTLTWVPGPPPDESEQPPDSTATGITAIRLPAAPNPALGRYADENGQGVSVWLKTVFP